MLGERLVQRDARNSDAGNLQYDNDFWQFSLSVYGQAGVVQECLSLQEAIGIDVNLLLFCAWTGTRAISLSSKDIEAAATIVADWHKNVVRLLRSVRQQIKAFDRNEFENFRARIKDIELEAEQIEQAILFAYSKHFQSARINARDAITQNVKKYIEMKSVSARVPTSQFSASVLVDAALRTGS